MNLREPDGRGVWTNASVESVLRYRLSEAESESERMSMTVQVLSALIERVARDDQDALDIIGTYRWELDRRAA